MNIQNPCSELNTQKSIWKTRFKSPTASIPNTHVTPSTAEQERASRACFLRSVCSLLFLEEWMSEVSCWYIFFITTTKQAILAEMMAQIGSRVEK